jgi:hypothetical protein
MRGGPGRGGRQPGRQRLPVEPDPLLDLLGREHPPPRVGPVDPSRSPNAIATVR